jgi:hypothetical protein
MNRSAYRDRDAAEKSNDMAAAKESGAIEYSARVMVAVRSVPDEADLVEVRLPKNKHGRREEPIYLRVDRGTQSLWEVDHTPPVDPEVDHDAERRDRAVRDAADVARVLGVKPGLNARELRAAVGIGNERVDAAVSRLGDAVAKKDGKRGAVLMSLDTTKLAPEIATLLERA